MNGDELRALEPSLSETVSGGYWLPQERSVRPDTLVRGLIDYLQEHGVEVRRDTPVSDIETNDGKATAVFAAGERFPAETVVVAAGAWTPRLLKPLRVNVPIEAGKGYSIDLLRRRSCLSRCGDRSTCMRRASPLPRWTT